MFLCDIPTLLYEPHREGHVYETIAQFIPNSSIVQMKVLPRGGHFPLYFVTTRVKHVFVLGLFTLYLWFKETLLVEKNYLALIFNTL